MKATIGSLSDGSEMESDSLVPRYSNEYEHIATVYIEAHLAGKEHSVAFAHI